MGNGATSRYKPPEEEYNSWRKPKETKGRKHTGGGGAPPASGGWTSGGPSGASGGGGSSSSGPRAKAAPGAGPSPFAGGPASLAGFSGSAAAIAGTAGPPLAVPSGAGPSLNGFAAPSSAAASRAASRAGSNPGSKPSTANSGGPGPVAGAGLALRGQPTSERLVIASDVEDDDLAGFSNLVDAAAKAWEGLMSRKELAGTKDFNPLFDLGDMKDSVERSARRLEALRKEATSAAAAVEDKREALESICSKLEEQRLAAGVGTTPGPSWKLGDIAIRRGKGLCELSMVHHEADPPYFEVRMIVGGSIAGTEAVNLVSLTPPQQSIVRSALRDLDQARGLQRSTDDDVLQAQEELKQQHHRLTAQVEQRLHECANPPTAPAPPQAASPGPPLPGFAAPPGLPDLHLVAKWSQAPNGGEAAPAAAAQYPDMKGAREEFRGPSEARTAHQPKPAAAATTASDPPQPAYAPPHQQARPPGPQVPSAPMGFPSFDDLRRMEEKSQRERSAAMAASRSQHEAQASANAARAQHQHPQHPQAGPQAQDPRQQQAAEWVLYHTAQGQAYYHNEVTNETAWQLPPGAQYRSPSQQPQPPQQQQQQHHHQPQYHQQYAAAEQAPAADDPFADLRRKEEEMKQQREQWAQWYSQYCQWYSQQAGAAAPGGAAGVPNNAPPSDFTGAKQQHGQRRQARSADDLPRFGADPPSGGGGGQPPPAATVPPRGPPPPVLNAGFEDQAVFALKSSVLKEMEAMVNQGAPLAQRKKALRCLQITWHPDKNPDRLEVAKNVFQFIEETKPWFLHDPEGS